MEPNKEDPLFTDATQMMEWVDASYQLMPREILGVQKTIYGVVRQKAIAQGIFPTVPIPKGLRQYAVATEIEQEAPKFDDNFNREALDEVRKEEATFYPVFMHKDFALNMVDIQAGNNQWYNKNLLNLTVSGTVGTMADYKEKVIWRGYNISGRAHAAANRQGLIDTNSKGIMDTTNVQTADVGAGGDSNITAAGDGPASVGIFVGDLAPYDYYGPYDLIISPGCYTQLVVNQNSTTHITDIERMHSMIDINGRKLLRNMDITKYLLGTAETTSTGAMLFFDRKTPAGEPTCVIGEEFPIAYHPITRSRLGTSGKIIWAGIPMVLRPYAFSQDAAITT
jgi:uncharacterized linocin/CFP29 family protein